MSSNSTFKYESKQNVQDGRLSQRKSKKSALSVKLSARASEYRKNTKPLMEKRRRERINRSLDELKNIILHQTNHNPIRNHKLEKADILELTVKHLKTLQKQKFAVSANDDPNIKNKYKLGYHECVQECLKFITSDAYRSENYSNDIDDTIRQRLILNLYKQYQSVCAENLSNLIPEDFKNFMSDNFVQPQKNDLEQDEKCSQDNFVQPLNYENQCLITSSSCSDLNVSKDSDCFNILNVKTEMDDVNDSKVWRPW